MKRLFVILIAAAALSGCGAASSSSPAIVGPTGQPLSSSPSQSAASGQGRFVSTTNTPPESSSLRATCTPTSISGSPAVMDYTLTITSPAAYGAVPIDVTSIAVFLWEGGMQQSDPDHPSFSHFTLNPAQSVTLHLSSPLGATPGSADTWTCGLSGVNVSE